MFMMARIRNLLLLALTTQIYVNAAPSDVSKLEHIAKVQTGEPEAKSTQLEASTEDNAQPQGERKKRWYDFGGFGFPPPINPVYPNYVKRDESQNTGVYGLVDDPLTQVFRRIQDIASFTRQPSFPPQLPPHFPIYLPVLYLPQDCNCNTQNPPQTPKKNETRPGVDSRFPEMEDTRQNWGYVEEDIQDDGEDFRRPINFNPIRPNMTTNRPPPPVEHGSVQGEVNTNTNSLNSGSGSMTTTTRRPPQNAPPPPMASNELPTNCDAAILSCCHRPEITFDCFSTQGCPDASSHVNPCEPSIILRVIERFQKFYLQRTG